MRAIKLANLGISAVIQAADCMTPLKVVKNNNVGIQCGCFAFDLKDDAVRHFLIKILQEF